MHIYAYCNQAQKGKLASSVLILVLPVFSTNTIIIIIISPYPSTNRYDN